MPLIGSGLQIKRLKDYNFMTPLGKNPPAQRKGRCTRLVEGALKGLGAAAAGDRAESKARRPIISSESGHPFRRKAIPGSDERRPPC